MKPRQDLTITVMETSKEQFFNQKCNSLLKLCNNYHLTNYAMDPVMFNSNFTNAIISEREAHFILLKKYYLSIQKETKYSIAIRTLINEGKFQEIEALIDKDPIVRGVLMENYLENINERNHDASVKRMELTDYDEMNTVLLAMRSFYSGEVYEANKQLVLKYN